MRYLITVLIALTGQAGPAASPASSPTRASAPPASTSSGHVGLSTNPGRSFDDGRGGVGTAGWYDRDNGGQPLPCVVLLPSGTDVLGQMR